MTMINGGRGSLYNKGAGDYPGGSGVTQPNSGIVSATQDDLEALTDRYEGRIDNWRERFPEDRIEHYRDGASVGTSALVFDSFALF